MKTTVLRLLCLLALLVPMTATSQSNIKSAFDAIIKCPKAEITESHVLNKDRETNIKSGQDDIYSFVIPSDRFDLIKNVLSAFDKDMASAYVVRKGKNTGSEIKVLLYSGESVAGASGGISIDDPGCDYIYELFAPSKSEDPDGNHRYAYGFNYKEEDGKIVGKLVINYSTTAEYRQKAERANQLVLLADLGKIDKGSSDDASQQSWFEQVMACVNGIEDHSRKPRRIALATKAYNLIKDHRKYPDVTQQDRRTLLNIFRVLVQKKEFANDPVLIELLRECVSGLN